MDTEREWDTPGRGGQFVGGGGSSNEGFVGGGDPNFVPTGNDSSSVKCEIVVRVLCF